MDAVNSPPPCNNGNINNRNNSPTYKSILIRWPSIKELFANLRKTLQEDNKWQMPANRMAATVSLDGDRIKVQKTMVAPILSYSGLKLIQVLHQWKPKLVVCWQQMVESWNRMLRPRHQLSALQLKAMWNHHLKMFRMDRIIFYCLINQYFYQICHPLKRQILRVRNHLTISLQLYQLHLKKFCLPIKSLKSPRAAVNAPASKLNWMGMAMKSSALSTASTILRSIFHPHG